MQMKTYRYIGMALVAMLLSLCFNGCSSDDDEEGGLTSSLAGTTWKIISHSGFDEGSGDEDDVPVGTIMKLNADGNITFITPLDRTGKWSEVDGKLKIVIFNEDGYTDGYALGTFSINENTATYNYTYYDDDGEWENGGYTVTLQKQ